MVSLISAPTHCKLPIPVNSFSVFAVRLAARQALPGVRVVVVNRGSRSLGCVVKSRGVLGRCKIGESEEISGLEQEMLEFMVQSEDPDRFPSRKELIEGGKRDLADAIAKRGGWMAKGWDLVCEEKVVSEKAELDALLTKWNSVSASFGQGISVSGSYRGSFDPPASSSGRSVETEPDEDAGVNGILNRIAKQRNLSMDLYREKRDKSLVSSKNQLDTGVLEAADSCYPPNDAEAGLSRENNTVAIQEKMLSDLRRENNLKTVPSLNELRNSLKPDTWRTWSMQRAGFLGSDFEAAEIISGDSGKAIASDSSMDQIIALHKGDKEEPPEMIGKLESGDKHRGNKIRSRLHNVELELSSALHLLRSNNAELSSALHSLRSNTADVAQKVVDPERLSEVYMNLADECEFKENEIMTAQDKLRSLRARQAILKGKVALTKIDEQKVQDEKQNRINDARKALQLLRTTCVVWPNSASEVLVTGTFDGWATQRKMEKSSNGYFSLSLRLYPGTYEFKFIVDGMWKIDPLRPIVNNNGNQNNLLIVT